MKKITSEFPLINAVLEKKQEGRVFNLDTGEFIIHKAGFSEITGSVEPETFIEFMLNEKRLPQYFHIYDATDAIIKVIQKDDRFGTKLRKRVQLRYQEDSLPKVELTITSQITFNSINANNFDALQVFNLDLENKFWSSKEDFLTHGYGIIAFLNGSPASICYSACVANNLAEIDVATIPDYQGKGLAKAVTIEFIKESFKREISANWDCFEENLPSLKTARSLGFKKLMEYPFLSVFINDK